MRPKHLSWNDFAAAPSEALLCEFKAITASCVRDWTEEQKNLVSASFFASKDLLESKGLEMLVPGCAQFVCLNNDLEGGVFWTRGMAVYCPTGL